MLTRPPWGIGAHGYGAFCCLRRNLKYGHFKSGSFQTCSIDFISANESMTSSCEVRRTTLSVVKQILQSMPRNIRHTLIGRGGGVVLSSRLQSKDRIF